MTISTAEVLMPRPEALEHSVWIDRLRASLTILVIWHHAAITYGASGSWFFKATDETSLPLTFMAAVNQAFFMGLFFLISGALSTASLDRKGTTAFLADRALRLGLPVLVFGFLLGPLTVALASAPLSDVPRSAVDLILRGTFVLGPLWFPAVLLVFSIVVASWLSTDGTLFKRNVLGGGAYLEGGLSPPAGRGWLSPPLPYEPGFSAYSSQLSGSGRTATQFGGQQLTDAKDSPFVQSSMAPQPYASVLVHVSCPRRRRRPR